jgi:hypothetical protein
MVRAMALNLWRRGHLQWHELSANFNENATVGSNAFRGGHTNRHRDRQYGDHFPFYGNLAKNSVIIENKTKPVTITKSKLSFLF